MNILKNPHIKFSGAGLYYTDEKWIHPERTETTYEIIYVTKGEVYLGEGEREYRICKGQLVLLEPNISHWGSRVTENVSFYWLHFHVFDGELPFEGRFFDNFESKALFKEILHWNNIPNAPDYIVNSVLLHILSELCWLSSGASKKYNERAEAIKEWIRINADAKLTVRKVADHFGYSPDHVSRICKNNYGIGASKLINRFLMERARELLCNTAKYVKEIAAELGFSDDKEFISYFKYHEGCFPSEYRNRFPMIHMNKK